MADVNRGDRPLSPHLQVYRPQITSVLSILHRATGVGLAVALVMAVFWFLGAAAGPEAHASADGWMTSWLGLLILFAATWGLAYHFCNGIRHLIWDLGLGFELDQVTMSGQIALVASGVLTLFVWIALI